MNRLNWYKKAQEIYRGDPNLINIQDFDPEYGVKELGKELGSSASEGPGIYFTSNEENARTYGKNITKMIINNANILTPLNKPFSKNQIKKILNNVSKETMEIAASNWDENFYRGKEMLVNSIMNEENAINQIMSIWADVYYHQNPLEFMILMTNNGIDGITIPKEHVTHYVIYNRDILK